MVVPPQAGARERLQNDNASFRRPNQPSSSLASIPGAAIQSIFQHLEMASAAILASTCKICFDEHQHQCADMYERAYQQLTPEVTVDLVPQPWNWEASDMKITMHWADEVLLLQMYRIALRRKALQKLWSFVWPANLYELIWTAAMKIGNDWLAGDCKHYMQTQLFHIWNQANISCKDCKSPLADAWTHDICLDKAALESLRSACVRASVYLRVTQQAVGIDGVAHIYRVSTRPLNWRKDAHNNANAFDDNGSYWGDAHSMFGPDPEFVWDSFLDWMHEVPSEQNAYAEQDQIFACKPIGKLSDRGYTRRPYFVRGRQCRGNRQANNRVKQPRKWLDKHDTGKHKRVGLVQWEMMLEWDENL